MLALEKVKKQRDAEEKLEEKLQRLKEVKILETFQEGGSSYRHQRKNVSDRSVHLAL